MRHVLILFILGIFLSLIGIYISTNISPFYEERIIEYAKGAGYLTDNELVDGIDLLIKRGLIFRMLDSKNMIAFILVWSSAFVCFFTGLHLSIDKILFKKFYESPNISQAYRRGIFIAIIFIGLFFLRLVESLYWYNALAIILLMFFIEILISSIARERKFKSNDII
jgi:hypothetical protein